MLAHIYIVHTLIYIYVDIMYIKFDSVTVYNIKKTLRTIRLRNNVEVSNNGR